MSVTSTNPDGSERVRLDRVTMLVFGAAWPRCSAVTGEADLYRWLMGYPPEWLEACGVTPQLTLASALRS